MSTVEDDRQQEEAIEAQYAALTRHLVEAMMPAEYVDEVGITTRWVRGQLHINLEVPEHERGLFIGRGGHMARSLRSVIAAASLDAPGAVVFEIS